MPTHGDRRAVLIGGLVWVVSLALLLPFVLRGWFPHDEGLLGQLGERALLGQLPHRDFDDPYSGALSWLYAAAFAVGGIRLATIRWVLLAAAAVTVPFLYALARRWLTPVPAALATLVAVAWTVPNYFAGLPSWYNLFLALIVLWALLRADDAAANLGGDRRWLVLAGLAAGVSTTVKISGLYALAAALLTVVEQEGRAERDGRSGAAAEASRRDRRFLALATVGGAAFVAVLVALVAPSFAGGKSGSPLALCAHFVAPGTALVAWLLVREARTGGGRPFAARLRRLGGRVGWLLLGWALPVGSWIAVYAGQGALGDLARGLFVLPALRFQFAAFPLPGARALLAALPLLVLALWPRPSARRAVAVSTAAVSAGALVALALAREPSVYRAVWLPLRALSPAVVLGGLWLLRPGGGRRRDPRLDGAVYATLATAAMVALIQYPDAYGIYFFYTVPVLLLAWLAVASANPTSLRWPLGVVMVFLGAFAVRALWTSSPATFGLSYQPMRWDFPLELPRGGLVVDGPRGAEATAVVLELAEHVAAGDAVLAAPDCPEIVFLAGARNPTRTFFEFFDPTFRDPDALLELLERETVRAVVINTRPTYSPPLSNEVAARLFERYPRQRRIGRYIVLW